MSHSGKSQKLLQTYIPAAVVAVDPHLSSPVWFLSPPKCRCWSCPSPAGLWTRLSEANTVWQRGRAQHTGVPCNLRADKRIQMLAPQMNLLLGSVQMSLWWLWYQKVPFSDSRILSPSLFMEITLFLFCSCFSRCWSWRLTASSLVLTNVFYMLQQWLLKPEASLIQCGKPFLIFNRKMKTWSSNEQDFSFKKKSRVSNMLSNIYQVFFNESINNIFRLEFSCFPHLESFWQKISVSSSIITQ